jgi:L-threonylcarbamoyladenylate synthase
MSRRVVVVDAVQPAREAIEVAAQWLRSGGVAIYPTDTFYGIAADPASPSAVDAVFAIKGRGSESALPLIADRVDNVVAWCGAFNEDAAGLAEAFWPGPLSLILDAPSSYAPAVHAGTGTIAVRVPAHAVARALAAAFGGLVTATSANRTGQPPVRAARDLDAVADDSRVLVLDGGVTPGDAPSTIVDARATPPRLVRAGAIAWSRVLESLKR